MVIIVTQLTLMETNRCRTKVNHAAEIGDFLFQYMICDSGVPHNITICHGKVLHSWLWDRAGIHNSIDYQLSTTFLPKMDGQTKQQNKTIKQWLTPCGTTSQTTGSKYYHSWSSCLIALFTTPNIYYSIRRHINTILQCNSSYQRLPVSNCRCRQTCG